MSRKNSIKKLAVNTLAKYDVSSVDEAGLKSMIAGEGYTVIRFSSLGTTDETSRLLKALYLEERIQYQDSFTYNDRERRIVFIRKDVSDAEFMYLLAVELGRILTFKTECDGVIGTSASEDRFAQEFAFYMCDFANHGIIYNLFKCYTPQIITVVLSAIVSLSILCSFFFLKGCDSTENSLSDMNSASGIISTYNASANASNSIVTDESAEASLSSYYATKSGTKYHEEDCEYIAGKDVNVVTSQDISSGKYSACSRCIK